MAQEYTSDFSKPTQSVSLSIVHGDPFPADMNAPKTLVEALQNAAKTFPNSEIIYLDSKTEIIRTSYSQLLENASQILAGLRNEGLQPGDKVILQLDRNSDLIPSFWGCILGGLIPIILEVPPSYRHPNPPREKLLHIWQFLDYPAILTCENHRLDLPLMTSDTKPDFSRLYWMENLLVFPPNFNDHSPHPDEMAFFNLSSGSTGIPKCIQLTHRNLIHRAIAANLLNHHSGDDVILNWLPFDHIGSISDWHIRCILLGCKLIYTAKETVLTSPLNWLDLIDRHRVTHSWAPAFAYGLINQALETPTRHNWDLSCVKFLLTAGEAIGVDTIETFLQKLAIYGLKRTAICPAFGMAELGSGITYFQPTTTENYKIHSLDKAHLTGQIKRVEQKGSLFVDLGRPIAGVTIRIVDEKNHILPIETVGNVQVKGDVVSPGYYNNPEANRETFVDDGWLVTGDLGFISDRNLTLIGRSKDSIIINGINYYSHEIEAIVETLSGIAISYTAACAVHLTDRNAEKLAIFFHPTTTKNLPDLIQTIRQTVLTHIGINPDYLIPVEKNRIPKTAIGKIQRRQLARQLAAGEFDAIIQQFQRPNPISSLPETELEETIAHIWKETLGLSTIASTENFFELGGNSLLLIQVRQKIQENLGHELSIIDLFRNPTVAALAQFLSSQKPRPEPLNFTRHISQTADIAVIGMAGRFPGADNIEEFWQNLKNGVESIAFFTESEILASGIDPQLVKNPNYVKASPILSDIESFDADFFGYTPKEAELIDPQQRLLLECAWESLEDAGCDPLNYKGKIGIYAGAAMNTYLFNNLYPNRHQLDPSDSLQVFTLDSMGGFQTMVANDKDYLTTRISYKLNLTGPSFNLQTACSTSLVAVHVACQSLLNGECDLALAGGVSVRVPQKQGYLYQDGMIVSKDGHCRAFDAAAGGTIFGSGVGLVVLKRWDEAIADRDRIYAVIKGSAAGNDGGTKVGYLAPNGEGQTRVAAEAMAIAGITPDTIDYVEAHGTGTHLGDPIEIGGLSRAFELTTNRKKFCAIGSVKTNIGHLQIASGIAGFIKTVLSLYHRQLPPSLHFQNPNPQIDFEGSPFYVNTVLKDWFKIETPRRAGVNSLGVGGTNAHVILEEAPEQFIDNKVRPSHYLFILSAKTETALKASVDRHLNFWEIHPHLSPGNIAFTTQVGRSHFQHRLAIVADSIEGLKQQLTAVKNNRNDRDWLTGNVTSPRFKIAFLFGGQGSQSLNMGRQLYETQPTFRNALDHCDRILRSELEKPLLSVLYPQSGDSDLIDDTAYSQPAIFAIEYALFTLWKSWGISPQVVLGHSLGEYVAACVAGVLGLEDGLKLVAARGRLMRESKKGKMVAIFADKNTVESLTFEHSDSVAIAAINNPKNIVISGLESAIESIVKICDRQNIQTQVLKISCPGHSPLMRSMVAEFEKVLNRCKFSAPKLNLISNVTGEIIGSEITTSNYWCRHLLKPVQFSASLDTLEKLGCNVFIECSARPHLSSIFRSSRSQTDVICCPSLSSKETDWQQLLRSLGQLYVSGIFIDWKGFNRDYSYSKSTLPSYPFQRRRYWIDPPVETVPMSATQAVGDRSLLGGRISSPLKQVLFQSKIAENNPDFLADHRIYKQPVLPATAYLEIALSAAQILHNNLNLSLDKITFNKALFLSDPGSSVSEPTVTIQSIFDRDGKDSTFQIYSQNDDAIAAPENWTLHCSGKIIGSPQSTPIEPINLQDLREICLHPVNPNEHYQNCRSRGLEYGENFQVLKELWIGKGEALGRIELPECQANDAATYQVHPVLLDGCFQVILTILPEANLSHLYLPIAIEKLTVYRQPQTSVWSHVRLRSHSLTADIKLFDSSGHLLLEVRGLTSRKVDRQTLLGIETDHQPDQDWQNLLYEVEWQTQNQLAINHPTNTTGHWLILGDCPHLAQQLKALLAAAGQTSTALDLTQIGCDAFQTVFNAVPSDITLTGVIYLSELDKYQSASSWETLLNFTQALISQNCQEAPQFFIVTRGTQSVNNSKIDSRAIVGSTLWGMGKTIASEFPELRCVLVDLDPTPRSDDAEQLFQEILSQNDENQIAFRNGDRWVPRLIKKTPNNSPVNVALQLKISQRGTLENLRWLPTPQGDPKPGEVKIKVKATGLNFRDVLNALDLYPGKAGQLGLELAGEIVAVGEGVNRFNLGDRVIAIAPGSFSQFLTLDAQFVTLKPQHLNWEESATIPGAFLTAFYTLHTLAKIAPGDRILIHAATGGVGLAAVQLAQKAGAEVWATASPNKWPMLQSLGIKNIMNSRSLNFSQEMMTATHNEGVDIVLNSLAGDFIPHSLSTLKEKGRFVEIGKQKIWSSEQVARFKPGVSYFVVDLIEILQHQPDLIQSLLSQLTEKFNNRQLQPLPHQTFPSERVVEAFRFMQQAKHIGKIIVTPPLEAIASRFEKDSDRSSGSNHLLESHATYLITGGLGDLGFAVAKQFIQWGAKNIVLMGRNDPQESIQKAIDALPANIIFKRANVANFEDLAGIFEEIDRHHPPLKGVIHAAGMIEDKTFVQQNRESFERTMEPKLKGGWNLHQLTCDRDLDFFILFSSVASLLGSAGQSNYSAANSTLDTLAHFRRQMGQTATSINWGAWSEIGLAHRTQKPLSIKGMGTIDPQRGLTVLEWILKEKPTQVSVIQFDDTQLILHKKFPFLCELFSTKSSANTGGDRYQSMPAADAYKLLRKEVRSQLAIVLGLDETVGLDPREGFTELGLDSLTSVEFRNRLQNRLQRPLPATVVFDYPTLEELTNYLGENVLNLQSEDKNSPVDDTIAKVEQLSEEDAEEILLKKLNLFDL
ncbi:MAG: SDR family NAD(P)-dependent oxidoreductase [Limnospira sp.]